MMLLTTLVLCVSAVAQSKSEDNNGPDLSGGWPTAMTLDVLRQEGLIDAGQIDSTGTQTTRLASQKVGNDLWTQVYSVRFKLRTGKKVEAIAVVSASPVADMRSGPVVYVVSRVLNPEGKPEPAKR
jgi:hypothetical protein